MVEDRIQQLEIEVQNLKTRLDYKKDEIRVHNNEIASLTEAINDLTVLVSSYHERNDLRIRFLENASLQQENLNIKIAELDSKIKERDRIIAVLVVPGILAALNAILSFL